MPCGYNENYWAKASDSEIEQVATHYFGSKPSFRSQKELRFGSRGSKVVSLAAGDRGKFYDHEAQSGGYLPAPGGDHSFRYRDPFSGFECHSGTEESVGSSKPGSGSSRRTSAAHLAWSKGQKICGTAAERYLASRGVMPEGDVGEVFRFGIHKGRRQLLVAAHTWVGSARPGDFTAIQRIFLNPDGSKDFGEDGTAKKVLGTLRTAAGDAAFFIMRGSDRVFVHEGVEDALSTRRAFIEMGLEAPTVVATFGVGRLKEASVTFPGATFVPDADHVSRAEDAARRANGFIVNLAFDGCKDVNDILCLHGAEALAAALRGATKAEAPDPEEARRERQRAENREIGEGTATGITIEQIEVLSAIERFVFVSDGSRVSDLHHPAVDLAFSDFAGTFAASTERREINGKLKDVPVSVLWKKHPNRKTVVTRTFRPGKDVFTFDPDGRKAVNTWRPYLRAERSANFEQNVRLFYNHVAYLFGADTDRFLDWVAHIEQVPGELPHTAWLHVSERTGTGRNALAGILTRVWRGHVAASIDLVATMRSGFNGRLSSKLLAVVDEIREGGRDQWEHSEKLKSLITEEHRSINPKYGRQSVEFNCCRLLMFSNHRMALPINENDRRIEAVICSAEPQPQAYYTELYTAVLDPVFINDIAVWLGERDLSNFQAGRRATETEAKREIARASESEGMSYARQLVAHWPADVVPAGFVAKLINPDFIGGTSAAARAIMADVGIVTGTGAIKLDSRATRVSILRNVEKWRNATPDVLRKEIRRAFDYESPDPRETLDSLLAEKAVATGDAF